MTSPFAYLFGHIYGIHNHFESISINALKSISINLGTPDNPKDIKLADDLTQEERDKVIYLLTKYPKVFDWSYKDMSGID